MFYFFIYFFALLCFAVNSVFIILENFLSFTLKKMRTNERKIVELCFVQQSSFLFLFFSYFSLCSSMLISGHLGADKSQRKYEVPFGIDAA